MPINTYTNIATVGITILALYIAYQQYRIQKAKVRLDLYEKRFRVFELTRNIILKTLKSGPLFNQDVLNSLEEFSMATSERHFLFKKDVNDFIANLKKDLIEIYSIDDNTPDSKLKDKKNNLLLSFHDKVEDLPRVFSPYLSFKKL